MSYLNYEQSFSREYDQPASSKESESEFLKFKLIQTHSKLITELEVSKQLEEELKKYKYKYENVRSELQNITRKMNSFRNEKQRSLNDKLKQLEINLVESEKKNDLLRLDLDDMRSKMISMIEIKKQLEQKIEQASRVNSKLVDKNNLLTKESKALQTNVDKYKQELELYKNKFEKQLSNNNQIQHQLSSASYEKMELIKKRDDYEQLLRAEREKNIKIHNQLIINQKEIKEYRNKYQNMSNQINQYREQNTILKNRNKNEERNIYEQLQKLTSQFNNLQVLYKHKQRQAEEIKNRQAKQPQIKKNKIQNTKQLMNKQDREEMIKFSARQNSKQNLKNTPLKNINNKHYKEQKEQYLSLIEEVGSMQAAMLNCNIEKRRILAEIDKIDGTRVKTKDMVTKRKKFEIELQSQQKKLQSIKNQLKKMRLM